MRKMILVVESGADIPKEYIGDGRTFVVPMHVSMYGDTLDDGSFPVEEIFAYHMTQNIQELVAQMTLSLLCYGQTAGAFPVWTWAFLYTVPVS